jgi:hypothetical protein
MGRKRYQEGSRDSLKNIKKNNRENAVRRVGEKVKL